MSLQYDDFIFPCHDICTNDTLDQLHHNNKLLYQDVLKVDYPWPKDFDKEPGDIGRIRKLFDSIDWVFSDACQENRKKILEISQHNYDYLRSQEFIQSISKKNQEALDHFLESY